LPGSHPLYATRTNKTILFVNHRSLADFFLHDCITGYQASYLARMLVAILFPGTWLCTFLDNSVWYFVRGGRGDDLEPFFKWIDKNFNARHTLRKSLIVYPEGHRNLTDKPLPLKKGFIRYSWERKRTIQIIMAFGLEEALDEKKLIINTSGSTISYWYDEPIFPEKFNAYPEFEETIIKRFNKAFYETHAQVKALEAQENTQ